MNRVKALLFTIIILASLLRLWGLSSNPPALTSDEAALGYNAYSILKTGRDEHGELLPIIFKSFGDWKPGLYVYLTVPFVALFGLNEFSVRLVGALSGIAAVYLIYLLSKKLFNSEKAGVIASFILATLPWHIHFSRGAWEISLAFTLLLAGIYLFFKARDSNKKYLYYSAIMFGLTYWTYQGAKLATTLVVLTLVGIYFKDILKLSQKIKLTSGFIGILLLAPIILSLLQGKGGRLEVFSVFSYPPSEEFVDNILIQEPGDQSKNSLSYKLYHSETLHFTRGVLGRYLNHYSPRFLFFEGDWSNLRHSSPNTGQLLLIHLVFLIGGFIALSNLKAKKEALVVWFLFLTLSLPSALSRDSIQAVRSFNMVLPLVLVLGLGAVLVLDKIALMRRFLRVTCYLLLITMYALNLIYYLDSYFVHMPKKTSQDWGYGYKQIVEATSGFIGKAPEIVVKQSYAQPYIYYLFYTKFDPASYQKGAGENYMPNNLDVGLVSRLNNISFREISWGEDKQKRGSVFVVETIIIPHSEYNDPEKYKIIKEIKYLNNQPAYTVVEVL